MNNKQVLISGVIGVLYMVLILTLVKSLGLNRWGIISLLTVLSTTIYIYQTRKELSVLGACKHIVKSFLLTSAIIFVISILGMWGVWGFVITILALAGWRIYAQRILFAEGMRSIETQIWGKPLDKPKWQPDEFENTEVKFKWKK